MSSHTLSPVMTEAFREGVNGGSARVAYKQAPTSASEERPKANLTPEVCPRAAESLRSGEPQGQIVLVLQGGGALGAYQAGVYQGLCEGGIVPDWVIGTSIGAINGALIAGNAIEDRLGKLKEFWGRIANRRAYGGLWFASLFGSALANFDTVMQGVPGFFQPNPAASWSMYLPVGLEHAALYTTEPLRRTLAELVDFDYLNRKQTRLTVGAVSVRSGQMRYFDSREMDLDVRHVMASGALPPAFPAVRIGDDAYWDGGIYSNTPMEAVLDDKPRRDSLIFSVNIWQPHGAEPASIWEVFSRQKDIQYASRGRSHIARQDQIHRLRHVIRQLEMRLTEEQRNDAAVRELISYGCRTTMHLVRLLSPKLDREDHTKDIDFTRVSIESRWQAGYEHARRVLAEKPWECEPNPLQGIVIHERAD
ncbi:MAG: patatin-like phospholipase family protein [Acetobacteraceae bacterium]|nr:patatin-like phospholipase family protein [Acetobacteraceae bacterium]